MAKSSAYRVPNPLPSPETGTRPARSHSIQSEAGAAPSHCVADAPVPQRKPSGQVVMVGLRGSEGERVPGPAAGDVLVDATAAAPFLDPTSRAGPVRSGRVRG